MRVRRFAGPDVGTIIGGAINAAASGSLVAGLSSIYDTIEIRSSLSPPAVINLHQAAADTSESELSKFLKPTIILNGVNGRDVIAPYGEAEGGWGGALFGLSCILGVGFALGRLSKR